MFPWRPWLAVWLALAITPAGGQPPAGDQPPTEDPPAAAQPPRELSIYIPYAKLRDVFEKEGRGVFLPYEQFQELWKAARDKPAATQAERPPVSALISEIDSRATVGKEVMQVAARLKIELLGKGWAGVSLGLADAALQSARIGDEPARIVPDQGGGYKLLMENADGQPRSLELRLQYARAFSKSPGQSSVAFQAPQAPVNRWTIQIPEAGAKVTIDPLLAATEVPPPDAAAAQTEVLAFVGAAPTVRIDWTHRAEGAAGLTALSSVETEQEVRIEDGLLRSQVRLNYAISRADLQQLVIDVPMDQKVVNVFDANVRQWTVAQEGDLQRITVQLFEPARGTQHLALEMERLFDSAAAQRLPLPVVVAVGAGRQQGVVAVRLGDALRGQPLQRSGLVQLDAADAPKSLSEGKWDLVYRYAALPWELALAVEKVQPRIQVDQLVEAFLEPEQMTVNLLALYSIERAGAFELQVDLPEGFEVRDVRGHAMQGAEPVRVDTFHLRGEKQTQLVVNLVHRAMGKVCLLVELHRRLADPNLLAPTGQPAEVPVPLPRVNPQTVEQSTGRVIFYAPESLRVNVARQEGLRAVSLPEALAGVESCKGQRFPGVQPVLSFLFGKQQTDLAVAALRRKPHVTAAQLLIGRIDAGVVKYEARLLYEIRYSGVKSLRVDLPADLAPDVRNASASIVEKVIDPPPDDLAAGDVAWSLTGETELAGNVELKFTWERRLAQLEPGKTAQLVVPRLQPRDVDRAWGQIVLAKAETLDVVPVGEPRGLRPIDPQHDLMPGAAVPDAARAFEFHEDWDLRLAATHYQLQEIKRTSIERALVRVVVTRSDRLATQALYRVRSGAQRLPVKLPEGAEFDTEPLRINGRAVSLERGDQGEMYIPLVGRSADVPFLLELRYTAAGTASRLDLPEFPGEPAVQKVFLAAFLPSERSLLGARGPWSDEPSSSTDDRQVAWVSEGTEVPAGALDGFARDGTLYLYSALQPAAAPDGSLRLVAVSQQGLRGAVFLLVVGSGLALARRRLSQRVVAVAAVVILLVLLGALAPTLARHVTGQALLWGLLLVAAVWTALAAARFAQAHPLQAAAGNAGPAEGSPATPPPPAPESPADGGPHHA